MHVGVLGPLEARVDGRERDITGRQPRLLLAALAVGAGRPVPVDTLIDALWGEGAPSAAKATLQSHVARLRRALGRADLVIGGPNGYRLAVTPPDVDAAAFEELAHTGRRLLGAGDATGALDTLGRALALWRGPAYAEFVDCVRLAAEATRLENLRLDAVQWRITAELAQPGLPPPVAELEALVQEYPTREALWALLMRALYRAGRQADALAAFRRARRLLVDELGIEPSAQLQETERLVLAQDPALGPAAVDVPTALLASGEGPVANAPPTRTSAERRVVSIVALEAPADDDADPEDVAARQTRLRAVVEQHAVAWEGSVREAADGSLLVVFGAPVAHEDDPDRAARLALAVLDRWTDDARPRAGIATGSALFAAGGPDMRVTGAPASEAGRLRSTADPGCVLVDAATARALGHAAVVEQRQGGTRLVSVRADHDRRPLSTAPFVGRSDDLTVLHSAFGKAVGSRCVNLVTVVGEPGIGKSRLAAELATRLGDDEVTWLTGRCRPYGEGTALLALSDIVKAYAAINDADETDAAVRKLRAILPADQLRDLEPRMVPLIGVDHGVTHSRVESFAAWRRFLELLAEQRPTVVLVEDIHWAAPLLLDFLDEVTATAGDVPLLVIVTTRPELFDARPEWGASWPTVRLSPLSDDDAAGLLESVLEGTLLDDGRRDRLVSRSGGVPLFVEELARLSRSSTGDGEQLPAELTSVIAARLDTIAQEHRATLAAVAVATTAATTDQLSAMTSVGEETIRESLAHLVRRQFLRRVRRPGAGSTDAYVVTHELVREAMETRLPRGERARLHLRAAQWWEETVAPGGGEYADVVAHHALTAYDLASRAGDDALATEGRAAAGRAAVVAGSRLQGLDTQGALRLLDIAVAMTEPGTRWHAEAKLWHGAALADDRQFEAAEAELDAAMAALEELDDPLRVDAVLFALSCRFALGHDVADVLAVAERARLTLPPSRAAVRNLAALAMWQLIAQTDETLRNAVRLADEAIDIARANGTGGDGIARVIRGRALLGLGNGDGMAELVDALDEVLHEESGTIGIGVRQWYAGALHHWAGPAAELQARQELESLAAARGLGFITSMGVAEDVRLLHELGRLRDAIELADDLSFGTEAQPRWAVIQRALALLDLGQLDPATVDEVRRTPPADDGDLRHVLGAALVAAADALRGDRAEDAVVMLQALGDPARFVGRDGAVELLPRLVRTAIAAGAPDGVLGVGGIDDVATPLRRCLADTVAGLLSEVCGDHEAAVDALQRAVDGWHRLGYAVEEALTRVDLSRNCRRGQTNGADEAADAAHAACSALGLSPLLPFD